MPSTVMKIETGKFGISLTDPVVTNACTATIAQFTDFTCQITSGALNASPNVSDDTTPATWCDPEQTTPKVGATSYELAITFLQDPQIMAGLSRTLYEHDTEVAWCFVGLDGNDPPKAVAKVRLVAGTFGGEARTALTADVVLPCESKPMVCFGDTGGSISVGGPPATGAVAGVPGTWTPAGSTPPASVADLIAGVPNTVVASPATDWTVGQYVQTRTAGVPGQANWNGTAWVAGVSALAAEAESAPPVSGGSDDEER